MKKVFKILLIIVFFISVIHVSYILFTEIEIRTINNHYNQQEINTHQAALSIENFFNNFKNSLLFISNTDEIINVTPRTENFCKKYFEAYKDELSAITRISSEGKIIYTYPYVEKIIGKDVSNQKHNEEIKRTHQPVISDVLETVQGYRAIIYAYPVFKNNEYNGCISLVIPFDLIAERFLSELKIGKTGSSFVISEAGIELFCTKLEHIGNSVSDVEPRLVELKEMYNDMLSKMEGRAKYKYAENESDELVTRIAVFRSIDLENTFWSIAIAIDQDEVLEDNRGFVIKLAVLLLLIALIMIIMLFFIARQRQKSRATFRNKELKYKNDLEKLVEVRTKELKTLNKSLKEDISHRKKIEAELKNAVERVEKSEKIKSEFLAQMSHEIRTPINTILSFSGLIKDELSEYANEELKYGFSGIQLAGNRLIRTIDLILNMSDIQLGTYECIPKEINICGEILSNLINEYKSLAKDKGLELVHKKSKTSVFITADSYTVNQIFANLLDNAIKYTEKGKITVECTTTVDKNFMVSVSDTGVGISQEYLPKIFDEFSQEDMGYTRKFEGNGLGLALVKKYCELNDATISVISKKGVGTKFKVIFKNLKS